ncbi:MAG TPA: hypothetical protein VEQ63_16145, partial [Bryobacteraceae bacterium]|nr:hypothetical protein [Bryobacteraceae bacterium]
MLHLDELLAQSRRRHLLNLSLHALSLAIIVGFGGLLLLLLAGTQVLDWYWPLLLGVVALAVALVRARRKLLGDYKLAQLLDTRLSLQDRLSTLFYFRGVKAHHSDSLAVIERQASSLVTPSDVKRAIPLQWPKSSYAALAMVGICAGTFALRYGLLNTLDLSRPVADVSLLPFLGEPKVEAASRKSLIQEHIEQQLQRMGLTAEQAEQSDTGTAEPQSPSESTVPTPDGIPLPGDQGQSTGEKGEQSGELGGESQGETSEQATEQKGPAENGIEGQNAKPPTGQQSAPKNGKPQGQNGITDKLRDTLANLMNKLGMDGGDQKGEEQQQAPSKTDEQGGRQSQAARGMQSQGRSQSEGQPSSESQDMKEGGSEPAPGMQSRASERAGEKQGSQDAKSGMGKQDGEKAIREAEQLAAMGKISEIFGKRASQITGEVTIEVPGGKQQLRTNYSQQQSRSTGYAAEVNRDEIPLMYQSYIQRYFEEL